MGWLAAGLAVLVTVALIVGEITNAAQRHWWGSHPLTTDTVSGLLVLQNRRSRSERKMGKTGNIRDYGRDR
jgi:hypothetical protein